MDRCVETIPADGRMFRSTDNHEYVQWRFPVRVRMAEVRSANTRAGTYAEMESPTRSIAVDKMFLLDDTNESFLSYVHTPL